ncbi:MAG: hypothetical protein FJW20_08395 [Acidimicrobiia bacterium]|nr:hypothetical protein [Acidimicrobiia bacterium]
MSSIRRAAIVSDGRGGELSPAERRYNRILMLFSELLLLAIGRSEIPLRFEPGAEEAVAKPVTEFLRAWIQAHIEEDPARAQVLGALIDELDGNKPVPV